MGGDTWENEEKASSLTWVALRQGWKPVKRLANLLQIEHVYYRGFCTFANHSECFFFSFFAVALRNGTVAPRGARNFVRALFGTGGKVSCESLNA